MSIFAVYDTIIDGSILLFIVGAGQADLSACWALWVRGPRDSLVPACWCQSVTGLDFGGSFADVEVQSAGELR